MADEEPMMEAVALSSPDEEEEAVVAKEDVLMQQTEEQREETTTATMTEIDDPFALPEEQAEVGSANSNNIKNDQEEESTAVEAPPLTDTQKALESLKRSSIKLGSVIDDRVGITKAVGDIDNKVHASQTLKSATTAIGGWWSAVDSQLGVSQRTTEIGHVLNETVVDRIKPTVMESTRTIQTFDETHGITASTATTLAKGADLLTQSLVGTTNNSNDGTAAAASVNVNKNNNGNVPSSEDPPNDG